MIRMAGGCTYTCRPNIIRREAGWEGKARQREAEGACKRKQAAGRLCGKRHGAESSPAVVVCSRSILLASPGLESWQVGDDKGKHEAGWQFLEEVSHPS